MRSLPLGRMLAPLAAAVALAALPAAPAVAAPAPPQDDAAQQQAAVRLVFAEVNATGAPGAYRPQVLRRRLARFMASDALDREARTLSRAIARLGGRRYRQVHLDSLTVGSWERTSRSGSVGSVTFVAYDTVTGPRKIWDELPPGTTKPLERYTVRMRWDGGRWRLLRYASDWLTPEGPMGVSGEETIGELPLRVVFRNPR